MIESVMRTLLQRFKAEVLPNTVTSTHDSMLEIAQLPVLVLFLPDITEARIDDANVPNLVKDEVAGTVRVYAPPGFYDLQFDFEVTAENTLEVLGVGEKLTAWIGANPYLSVGEYEYPLRFIEPLSSPNRAGGKLIRASGRFVVEGIEVSSGVYYDGKLAKEFQATFNNPTTGGEDNVAYSFKK
ncbi:hypothetical protein D2962_08150 [Biomaibacter acetigenes]|uniref:Uncharacterized protein n=1 Tax=Biomaibacter acetigenes TaxID=2316383 RepID=A0A3G2R4Z2_9FIRM|nr:hypothetical protein [Biomaibacter acetigenes]AYO30594.1 hypothetical protein D2962_08150 [Biomaibacter acetigenes]